MAQRRIVINDPVINEMAFDYLFSVSTGKRAKLNGKEIRAIRTATRARKFIERSTIDEKLFLLAKLGAGFTLFIHNGNPMCGKEIKQLMEKYKEMTKTEIVGDMAAHKIVVLSDRTLINFLNILSDTSHSETYLLNIDFNRVGNIVNNWKDIYKPNADNTLETLEFAKIINKFTFNVNMSMKSIKGVFEIADLDINILMYFYDLRTQYVTRDTIDRVFAGLYKKTIITAAMKRLFEKVLIERNPTKNHNEYQITALGNTVVMDFHKKNLSATV